MYSQDPQFCPEGWALANSPLLLPDNSTVSSATWVRAQGAPGFHSADLLAKSLNPEVRLSLPLSPSVLLPLPLYPPLCVCPLSLFFPPSLLLLPLVSLSRGLVSQGLGCSYKVILSHSPIFCRPSLPRLSSLSVVPSLCVSLRECVCPSVWLCVCQRERERESAREREKETDGEGAVTCRDQTPVLRVSPPAPGLT